MCIKQKVYSFKYFLVVTTFEGLFWRNIKKRAKKLQLPNEKFIGKAEGKTILIICYFTLNKNNCSIYLFFNAIGLFPVSKKYWKNEWKNIVHNEH